MKLKEAIENLEYAISGECTENFGDFVDEIEMAIEALKKQIPKEAIALTNRYPDEQYECPICGNMVGYPTFRNTPFGEIREGQVKYDYCLKCGQRLKWGEDDKQTE